MTRRAESYEPLTLEALTAFCEQFTEPRLRLIVSRYVRWEQVVKAPVYRDRETGREVQAFFLGGGAWRRLQQESMPTEPGPLSVFGGVRVEFMPEDWSP